MQGCWSTHPPYEIKVGDEVYVIQGGSCTRNYPKDVDVFIGFDQGMKEGHRVYPWEPGVDFLYPIMDTKAPKNIKPFKKLLEWTEAQLISGKSVYCGCIGGHGRTGLFLAALTTYMNGDTNSIETVRNNYCKKAVESTVQVEWLNHHFGIKKVKGSKVFSSKISSIHGDTYSTGNDWLPDTGVIDNPSHKAVGGAVTSLTKHKYWPIEGNSVFMGSKG